MIDHLDEGGPWAASTLPKAMQTRLEACTEAERAQLETAWQLAALGKQTETVPPIDTAWTRLQDALESAGSAQGPRKPHRKPQTNRRVHRRRGRLRWSLAGLIAAVVLGVVFWRQPVTIHAPAGTTVTATLPDGSRAELNSGSTLAYERRLFRWTRTLRLDGEVFFEVVHADGPFVVETFNAAVIVLGTRFNVRAWPGEDQPETVVVLQSGAVQLAPLGVRERPVRLEPGQMSRLPIGATQPSKPEDVSVDRMLAWRSGGLAFNNKPLGVILAEVERRFDIEIVARPRSITQDSLVLFLAHPLNAEAVLEAICRFRGYRYRSTDDGYEILQ